MGRILRATILLAITMLSLGNCAAIMTAYYQRDCVDKIKASNVHPTTCFQFPAHTSSWMTQTPGKYRRCRSDDCQDCDDEAEHVAGHLCICNEPTCLGMDYDFKSILYVG